MAPPIAPPRELTYVPLEQVLDDATFRLRPGGDVAALAQSIAQAGQLFPVELRTVEGGFQPLTGFRRLAALRILHRERVLARVHGTVSDERAAMIAAADVVDTSPLEREQLLELRERYRARGWNTPALEELWARAIQLAEERREDLAALLRGEAPPDRRVVDEDLDEDERTPSARSGAAADSAAAASKSSAEPASSKPPSDPSAAGANASPLSIAPASAVVARPPAEPPPPPALGQPLGAPAPQVVELTADQLAEDLARRLSELSLDLATLADSWRDVPAPLRGIVADQLTYYSQLGSYLGEEE